MQARLESRNMATVYHFFLVFFFVQQCRTVCLFINSRSNVEILPEKIISFHTFVTRCCLIKFFPFVFCELLVVQNGVLRSRCNVLKNGVGSSSIHSVKWKSKLLQLMVLLLFACVHYFRGEHINCLFEWAQKRRTNQIESTHYRCRRGKVNEREK